MPDIVGVRFKRAGKVYYFDPAGTELKVYDYVVVQTARGVELGQVTIAPKQVLAAEITAELKTILRKASAEDVKRAQNFAAKEEDALNECAKMIVKLNLPMKLVTSEYNLDGSRLTFYFTAEERVDFRELVKELTGFFKTRIELRQIGPRDQAKMIGGLGRCGRTLCCGSFLSEFNPVSIKMAKEQDLPLDPMKISGVCGRLQCCLAYESGMYHDIKAGMPRKGQRVNTPSGDGWVTGVYPLKDSVLVELESQAQAEFPVEQIKIIDEPIRPQPQPAQPAVQEEVELKPVVNTVPDNAPAEKPIAPAPTALEVRTETLPPAAPVAPPPTPLVPDQTAPPAVAPEVNPVRPNPSEEPPV
jgi:cell fate regulator YaaT (PSP1 superfamily)